MTFDPHPAAVFSPRRVPPLLTTVEVRSRLLHRHGAAVVVVARFDPAFAELSADAFAEQILRGRLRAVCVVVGDDFRYGRSRTGDATSLRAAGARLGFDVRVVPAVFVGGVPARSSVIRQMVAGGEAIEAAAALLGRPYALRGEVVAGRRLGRTLGYPTANVAPPPGLLVPGEGVYAGRVRVRGSWHRAAISVGTNPTVVEDGARTVEAYLLDGFADDIYGEPVEVEFAFFLRAQQKYETLDALLAQMARDVAETERRVSRRASEPPLPPG
jgi:riboflavin kinase/FMN adenylyltransferase